MYLFVAHVTGTSESSQSERAIFCAAVAISPVDDTVMNIVSAGILSQRDER